MIARKLIESIGVPAKVETFSDQRRALADSPLLCDFPRAVGLAQRDRYYEMARYLSAHRGKADNAFRTLSYCDCVNFAAQAKAPALFSVALMDTACPPSTEAQ